MYLDIIPIGNSQGIRLPKTLIEQCGFGKTVEVEVIDHQLIIKDINAPRRKWSAAFSSMGLQQEDCLFEESPASMWDTEEWEW